MCVFLFLTSCFQFFYFLREFFIILLVKYFFVEQKQPPINILQKKGVLCGSQNSSENTCIGVHSFSEVAGYTYIFIKQRLWYISFLVNLAKKKKTSSF